MSQGLAVETRIRIEERERLPYMAIVYAIKELARRAGVSAELFATWRVATEESEFVSVFVEPGTQRRIRFPRADLWLWKDLHARQFRTSSAECMHDPGKKFASLPNFQIPFSSDQRADIGPLFVPAGRDCVDCAVDLLTSVVLTLARFEETFDGPRDTHGRFSAFSSIAWRGGFLHRPIVDEYGIALEQAVSHLLPGWKPSERHLRVKLGHDVDEIGVPFSVRNVLGHTLRRKLPLATIRDFAAPWTNIDNTYEMLLRKLVRLSRDRRLDSAVYWKAQIPGTPNTTYDFRHKRVRRLIAELHAQGIELGLHPSYATFEATHALRSEVSAVRALLNEDFIGGRQDFLRWSPKTWVEWDALGLAYDASVGFADHIGFRAGTCFPYRPWLLSEGREADLLEIPLLAMDSTLFGYMRLSAEQALERLRDCVARCRLVGGVFTLLWHNSTLMDSKCSAVYEALLDELAGTAGYDWRAVRDGRCWN